MFREVLRVGHVVDLPGERLVLVCLREDTVGRLVVLLKQEVALGLRGGNCRLVVSVNGLL